ncbi:2-amino-4-hydroxy-6-hydroxymethyldihydropteridine diphosphokinase [Aeromonas dhakensis]|uniref:2-amino-4-hydroxy-6- hydroxymethyldihydropteridine diphosphokinase n=2 Tax=Aeromonadaceae TaxID=84642 RepID=UPI0005B78220|nr:MULTISPECIES: 2-amino-4-hydroxy-6-hydroxymethyldihydropteridine diphosphokinase [Aeromonas]MDD9309394.1 2-amino-4-hydroxy-6-hydroxymethyldihydropteridine diphosphokinase [Aeromonas hydrophila]ELM3751902.1 2-amino-4-hydroxy-6-hydroxymethyldihydropteridine diphosphokinase [Aeromonas dhakensis]MBL0462858.1 2-amino-4-hydroxy-6-hydroxymethyldihydropteridine diphosphokinase [Aeromonas dhakensis]MBL0603996.1 2-amino-4-hydroxy-6-hydroxymethyldihydropteridine diphosphokinase [Aeromonas dhakensis]MBL
MTEVFVAIGSNLADPVGQARRAIAALATLPDSVLVQASSLYSSRPMGPADQPDYVNAVARLNTRLAPLALLDQLQKIELEQGRVRKDERWGPRTLDLDLLLYGDQVINSERLIVPHYGMQEREFVLLPLAEIAPALVLPCGTPLAQLVARCPRNGLAIIAASADEQEPL